MLHFLWILKYLKTQNIVLKFSFAVADNFKSASGSVSRLAAGCRRSKGLSKFTVRDFSILKENSRWQLWQPFDEKNWRSNFPQISLLSVQLFICLEKFKIWISIDRNLLQGKVEESSVGCCWGNPADKQTYSPKYQRVSKALRFQWKEVWRSDFL